jgi:ABC-type transport system involved in multi-copper enzyme maturation permease subunit
VGIDRAYYHGWEGSLGSPWLGCLAIARVTLLQLLRRWVFWFGLGLSMFLFVLTSAIIYVAAQAQIVGERILEMFNFTAVPRPDSENGYLLFIEAQSVIVIIVLAFAGSLLVGQDFRQQSVPFYLCRGIERRHYIAGKLLAIAAVVAMMTILPALVLFGEFGAFTSNFSYWIDNWQIPVSIAGYSLVLCGALSVWIVSLSAWLQRMAPIAITWTSFFLILLPARRLLVRMTGDSTWNLIDPWRNLRYVGRYYFGTFPRPEDGDYAPWALLIVAGLTALALYALVRRVRAVEVVG